MERYKEYKDSGISWMKDIPSHWEERRIGALFTDQVFANSDFAYKHAFKFNYGTLVPKNEIGDEEEFRETYIKYSVLKKNDIVINGLNLNYDFVSQRVAIAPSEGIITSAYLAMRPRQTTNANYYLYVLKTMDNKKMFHGMGTGIRLTLSFDELKKQILPAPPIAEQEKIVNYLERKTSSIDAYVAEKEKELQLLNELKEAEIANVVTRGLNPNVKMKDYDSLLTDSCPEHWSIMRNKSFLSLTGEKVGDRANDYTLLSLTTKGVIVRDVESGKGKFPKDFDTYQAVKKDELVFCLFDIDETPRTVGLVESEGMVTGAYTALKVNKSIAIPEYVYYYYLCVDNIKALKPYYSGLRKTVRADKFLQIYIPLPPVEEQRAIVTYVEDKCAKVNTLIAELEAEIEYMKEYKQRLIADCVTGQVNVQNV